MIMYCGGGLEFVGTHKELKKFFQKFCMSHHGWVYPKNGRCPKCGSAMLENKDLR